MNMVANTEMHTISFDNRLYIAVENTRKIPIAIASHLLLCKFYSYYVLFKEKWFSLFCVIILIQNPCIHSYSK